MAFAMAAKADTAKPFNENLYRARVLSAFDGGGRNESRVIGIAVEAMKDALRSAGSDVSDDDAGDAPPHPAHSTVTTNDERHIRQFVIQGRQGESLPHPGSVAVAKG